MYNNLLFKEYFSNKRPIYKDNDIILSHSYCVIFQTQKRFYDIKAVCPVHSYQEINNIYDKGYTFSKQKRELKIN